MENHQENEIQPVEEVQQPAQNRRSRPRALVDQRMDALARQVGALAENLNRLLQRLGNDNPNGVLHADPEVADCANARRAVASEGTGDNIETA